MTHRLWAKTLILSLLGFTTAAASAGESECKDLTTPKVTFVQFKSPNIAAPGATFTIKGKLSLPGRPDADGRCFKSDDGDHSPITKHKPKSGKLPAVLILHGSGGVDSRGDFYEAALNAVGIATLQIDMWEARGVTGLSNRPQLPILTIPDAFSALAFLSARSDIDADRVGVLGFSWGGVVSLAASERLYAGQFGGGAKFAAHVANYPVCYGANNAAILAPFGVAPAQAGTQYRDLTGAPVLIQVGSKDSYDNSAAPCRALAHSVNPSNNDVVEVVEYPGAFHAWDRLMVPVTVPDPFANQGSYLLMGPPVPLVQIVPDVAQAYTSRGRVVQFFRRNL